MNLQPTVQPGYARLNVRHPVERLLDEERKGLPQMKTLTAETYYKMLCSGANLLAANCETINNMNVFPVPDGDTGSNMTMTMSGVYHFQFDPAMSLGTCASGVAENMLRCARGNSGVILSVFFRGVARTLKEKETATIADFAQAMDAGVKGAYQAVMNPTEGTILSVMRAASECAAQLVELAPDQDFETLFVAIITAADAALDKTPEQLPKLKEAGVVDAGGYGFLGILNAMNQVLKGDFVPAPEQNPVANSQPAAAAALSQAEITYPYCTECIVEKSADYKGEGKVGALHQFIEGAGDSAVFVDDDNLIKLHVHTEHPGLVINEAQRYGDLVTVKVENMRIQHSQLADAAGVPAVEAPAPKRVGEAIVAVANGEGISAVFQDMGVAEIITGGQTMNPSTQTVLDAVRKSGGETVFVLPNNGNIILAAQQAAELAADEGIQVFVVPTKTIQQGVSAMYAYEPGAAPEENQAAMLEASQGVHSLAVTYAVRDAEYNGKQMKKGQILGLVENKVTVVADDRTACLRELMAQERDMACVTVFYGEEVSDAEAEETHQLLAELLGEDVDLALVPGGQPVYAYLIAVE